MKIYMLMILVSTIAALSYLYNDRETPPHQA